MTKDPRLTEALDLAAGSLAHPGPAAPHLARAREEVRQASQTEDPAAYVAHLEAARAAIDEALKAAGHED